LLGALLQVAAGAAWASGLSDLEERIAELEQTVAGTGGRRMSVTMYGQINRAVLFWSDGFDTGTHHVDNHTSSSRFGFAGHAPIKPGWTAGYKLEFDIGIPSSSETFNGSIGDLALATAPFIRQSYWDIVSKDLGRVAVGFQSPATDDITIINLGSQVNDAAVHFNNAFKIRLDLLNPPIVTDLTWGTIAHNVDSLRGNFIRYDTPVLYGFLLSAAWNDDVWDVALRYQTVGHGFRFAGGFGYMKDEALRFQDAKGSASLMHIESGLYLSVAGGWRDAAQTVALDGGDTYFYYAQAGISRQWLPVGKTTFYVDHGLYKNFNIGEILSVIGGIVTPWGTLVDTEVHRWGFGVEQAIDASSMLIYLQAHFYDPTLIGSECKGPNCAYDPTQPTTKLPAASWQGFVVGARIQF
jgi:predicted porin